MSKPSKFIANPRLRWVIASLLFTILDVIVFVGCLRAENTQCTTITGVLGIVGMCVLAWHSLIYIAQRRAGM